MKIFIVLLIGLALSLTACEKELSLDIPEEEGWGVTLNAVASPDTTFYAYVTHCYPNTEAPEYSYPTVYYGDFGPDVFERDPIRHYYAANLYKRNYGGGIPNIKIIKESILPDADVKLTVNGETTYPMAYDEESFCYQSSYTPAIGDRLEVQVTSASGEQTSAQTVVPHPQLLEILDVKREDKGEEDWMGYMQYMGHVQMKLRLNDPPGEKNYYRLKIRGIFTNNLNEKVYTLCDTYRSADPIFRDERLTSAWGIWDAFFSDVFDDTLFDGQSYEFDIETYALGDQYSSVLPYFEVSLQSITEDYYRYMKSLMLFRVSELNSASEAVYIHSNNEGGWGMLGAMSGEIHRVDIQ